MSNPLKRLEDIAAKLRYVKTGDFILADDHNTLVDYAYANIDALKYVMKMAGGLQPASGKSVLDYATLNKYMFDLAARLLTPNNYTGFLPVYADIFPAYYYYETRLDRYTAYTALHVPFGSGSVAKIDTNKLADLIEYCERNDLCENYGDTVYSYVVFESLLNAESGTANLAVMVRLPEVNTARTITLEWQIECSTWLFPILYYNSLGSMMPLIALIGWARPIPYGGPLPFGVHSVDTGFVVDANKRLYWCINATCTDTGIVLDDWHVLHVYVDYAQYATPPAEYRVFVYSLDGETLFSTSFNGDVGYLLFNIGGVIAVAEDSGTSNCRVTEFIPASLEVDWIAYKATFFAAL